jgi:predicted outer membrane repeat protein
VVIFESGEDENTVLSGFTIKNGSNGGIGCDNFSNPNINNIILVNNVNYGSGYGGGLWVEGSNPSIENVIFKFNKSYGGGLYTHESDITLRNCLFAENSAEYGPGGAAFFYESNPTIKNCQFMKNWAQWGGAIYFRRCYVIIDGVLFERNRATWRDGGAFSSDWSHGLDMRNTIFRENSAVTFGGGFYRVVDLWNHVGFDYLENVTFTGNVAQEGGGIYTTESPDFKTNNVVFSNNDAEAGAGIYIRTGYLTLQNTVFEGNVADTGSAIHFYWGNLSLINSILWNNASPEVTFSNVEEIRSLAIAYSDIENGLDSIFPADSTDIQWLEGNMDKDPLFVNPGEGDYHLKEDSPCIDAGTAFFVYKGDTIVNYQPGQYNGSAPDMGAFEFGPPLDIEDKITNINSYELYQNYPNPFNPVTMISYQLSMTNEVNLTIYNILGQKVVTLVSERQEAGHHQVEWAASRYASGVYYYHFQANGFQDVKKMILLR